MAIQTVVTPAADRLLTTLVRVKEEIDLCSDEQDGVLSRLILQASSAVEAFLGRVLAQERVIETVVGHDNPWLVLSRTPVKTIHAVLDENGDAVTDHSASLSELASGLLYREVGWPWGAPTEALLIDQPVPGHEKRNFSVEYTGGYGLPNWSPAATPALPEFIERAVLETVKASYRRRSADGTSQIRRFRVESLEVAFGGAESSSEITMGTGGLPLSAVELLRSEMRIV